MSRALADVVLFMGMVLDPPMIVSEWCPRGSVYDILQKAAIFPTAAAQLTWRRRLNMSLDAAKVRTAVRALQNLRFVEFV